MTTMTRKQKSYIHDLAEQAGYEGDVMYRAGRELIDDGQWSRWTIQQASQLIDALQERIESQVAA